KIEEPISESEESDAESMDEETIYESMSDSAVEEASDNDESEEEEGSDDDNNGNTDEEAGKGANSEAEEAENDEELSSDDGIDEDALLAGIRGSDSEASDSESDSEFAQNRAKIDLDENASKKIQARLRKLPKSAQPGVVYLGRIPHGFYEEEMLGYFKQFGAIKRLRLSRNPKTGRSRHYGFVEFAHEGVAAIVADTMNNYLMFDHLLKCRVVPKDKVHPRLFANRFMKVVPGRSAWENAQVHNRAKTQAEVDKQMDRLVREERKRRKKLQAAGIDYDFPGYEDLRPPKSKHVKF
ncbi:nucleolar protein, partial [Coemansia sp. RSA 2611]